MSERIKISDVNACLYGKQSENVFLYIPGKGMKSMEAKEFSDAIAFKGWQVLGIELSDYIQDNEKIVSELQEVMKYIRNRWKNVALRASGEGAYFSALVYKNEKFDQILLVKPDKRTEWGTLDTQLNVLNEEYNKLSPDDIHKWEREKCIVKDNQRVTIKDIAENLGVSTATVSNVIHGKCKKISDETVEKVQKKLEESGYIPNMAAVLLARNTSRIVCVVLSDDSKYEGHMLEDPFIAGMLNGLSKELRKANYFMMIREEHEINQIVTYASMWNMSGLILIGYCQQDYEALRSKMHIPFVVLEACTSNVHRFSDIGLDNGRGGAKAAEYLYRKGHRDVMFLADNKSACDLDRYNGFYRQMMKYGIVLEDSDYKVVSNKKEKRVNDFEKLYREVFIEKNKYTACFCASDIYAIELMQFLQNKGIRIPKDFSVIGFDDIPMAQMVNPRLTTIHQDLSMRAARAVTNLNALIEGRKASLIELLPLTLIERESVADINK